MRILTTSDLEYVSGGDDGGGDGGSYSDTSAESGPSWGLALAICALFGITTGAAAIPGWVTQCALAMTNGSGGGGSGGYRDASYYLMESFG